MNESGMPIRSFHDLIGPGLAGIPVVGGPLSALWSQWDTNRRFARVEETLRELSRLLASRTSKIATLELGDEDMQILEMSLQRVQMAHTEQKRVLFARLVASSWIEGRERPFDERTLFVDALAAFNEYHLRVLAILNDAGVSGAVPYATLCDRVLSEISSVIERDSIMIPVLESLAAQYGFIRRAWGLNDPADKESILSSRNLSAEGIAENATMQSRRSEFGSWLRSRMAVNNRVRASL